MHFTTIEDMQQISIVSMTFKELGMAEETF